MPISRTLQYPALLLVTGLLAACGSAPPASAPPVDNHAPASPAISLPKSEAYFALDNPTDRREVVLFALGLLDTRYVFGGRNPEAGLDCSGMVSYVVEQISGKRLPHNAAKIAAVTRPVEASQLVPGDLVFFNTMRRKHSHMGIYLGDGKFVHAPNSRGRVRIERMDNPYFSSRLDGMRTLVDNG